MLAAFLRNDKNPVLATAGVLCGGVFNMVGDYVLVFTFDMGIRGAGLATAIGACNCNRGLYYFCYHAVSFCVKKEYFNDCSSDRNIF